MTIGFIGIGRIAGAVVNAICTSTLKDVTINISPRNEEDSKALSEQYNNVHRLESNQHVVNNSEIIFLSIPPRGSNEIISDLRFKESQTIVSLIPFLVHADLQTAVAPAHRISRAIPLPTVMNHVCPIPIYNSQTKVLDIFKSIGQPLLVDDEQQLHALWTLTGLISPFYGLLDELSSWSQAQGVQAQIGNKYLADLFLSLSHAASQERNIDFRALIKHASTPNGMNEQAGNEIDSKGAHEIYSTAADNLMKRFISKL